MPIMRQPKEVMSARLKKKMMDPKASKKDCESTGDKCRATANKVRNKTVETASTRLSSGAFQGST